MDLNHQEVPNRRGAVVARGADNPEDTGSKPVAGIYILRLCLLKKPAVKLDVKRSFRRCSSEEERLKHRLLPY